MESVVYVVYINVMCSVAIQNEKAQKVKPKQTELEQKQTKPNPNPRGQGRPSHRANTNKV